VFANDCGQGGCVATCSPSVSITDIETEGLLHHTQVLTSELVSTCCSRCEARNFDFGNGYNWLVTAWPYITDCQGPPLYVVLPPRSALRFCVVDEGYCPGGGNGYRYSPGCCQNDCVTILSSTEASDEQLRYQLGYDPKEDEFTFTEGQDVWRFAGFYPEKLEKGRVKIYESRGRKAEAAGYTSFGHITRINFLDTTGALSSFLEYAYATFTEAPGRLELHAREPDCTGDRSMFSDWFQRDGRLNWTNPHPARERLRRSLPSRMLPSS